MALSREKASLILDEQQSVGRTRCCEEPVFYNGAATLRLVDLTADLGSRRHQGVEGAWIRPPRTLRGTIIRPVDYL